MYIIEGQDILVTAGESRILQLNRVGLEEGKVFSVIGPNGSGKSTLLRVMALLQSPHSGSVKFRGKKVMPRDRIKIRRRMAVVFQEPLLLDATVEENVVIGLRIRGMDTLSARKRAKFWLERFKVAHLSKRWARAISGGEARRVSLAGAFALEPEVLFMDEPFANLDAPTRESLLMELSEVLHSTGTTTFFVSHDFKEVAYLADSTMALFDGKPIQQDLPQNILERPATERLAKFVGIENIWPARVIEATPNKITADIKGKKIVVAAAGVQENGVRLREGDVIKIALRGEKVDCAHWSSKKANHNYDFAPHNPAKDNRWEGTVKSVFAFGDIIKITAECGIEVKISVPSRFLNEFRVGDPIIIFFSAEAPAIIR
ncbi:MAG: tungstate transport system ATP-binding protein [Tepidanaerobacteraceae bacterium]|nr:tungstate transport system ATP-binding protein [Tepidanaerobacteraceae bacterium]